MIKQLQHEIVNRTMTITTELTASYLW